MSDKSEYPCKHCGHKQNDHGKHFPKCYMCEDNKKQSYCRFERLDNLLFLEWLDKKGEFR